MKYMEESSMRRSASSRKALQDSGNEENSEGTSSSIAGVTCFHCMEKGHYGMRCPKRKGDVPSKVDVKADVPDK